MAIDRSGPSDGWRTVNFGDVVRQVKDSVEPETSGLERYIAGEHMVTDDLHIRSWGTVGDGYLGPAFHRLFRKGQVLYGSRRTYLRKVAFAEFDGICANTTFVLEPYDPDELLPELLPFIMQTDTFNEHAVTNSRGSVNPYVNFKDIAWYEFALPPLDEQRRIAEILWAADNEAIKLWFAHEQLLKTIAVISIQTFRGQANDYGTVQLGELEFSGAISFQTGPFGTVLKASSYVDDGVPIVNPVNMVDGRFDTDQGPFISKDELQRLDKYILKLGDIVLGRKGEVGRSVFVSSEYDGYITGSDTIRIRVSGDELLPLYLYYIFAAPQTQSWLQRHASGTTMPGINEKILRRVEIPIPNVDVQRETIKLFRRLWGSRTPLLSKCDSSTMLKRALTNDLLSS